MHLVGGEGVGVEGGEQAEDGMGVALPGLSVGKLAVVDCVQGQARQLAFVVGESCPVLAEYDEGRVNSTASLRIRPHRRSGRAPMCLIESGVALS